MLIISGGISLGLLPFAIFRFVQGDVAIAIMNSTIVLGTALVFIHLYLTKRTSIAKTSISILTMCAMTGTIFLKGAENVHWVYPALTTSFFLLSPVVAAYLCLFFLGLVIAMIWSEVNFLFLLTFGISAGATFLFSFAFSKKMGSQAKFLRQLATTDALTGIGNRRKLEEKLLEITRRINRYPEQECSLIIFDLDFFKQINDNFGHSCGDDVLQRFAETISERIREADSLYRLGGEEFVLVLDQTHLFEAKTLANDLIKVIEGLEWDVSGLKITTSAGIAQYNGKESSYEWLQRADAALYRAKSGGRNCCFTSNEYATTQNTAFES